MKHMDYVYNDDHCRECRENGNDILHDSNGDVSKCDSCEHRKQLMDSSASTGRPKITSKLSKLLEKYIDPHNDPRIYWASEVTFDYATSHAKRVDYMRFKPVNNSVSGIEKGDFYCYEIKSSLDDFNSEHGHNFFGDFNYYVMPLSLYEKVSNLIPWRIGVYTMDDKESFLTLTKKGQRMDRTKSLAEMLLMMYRSARRDVVNVRRAHAVK